MKELSNNARKLLFAIGESNGKDISAHELGMAHDEFVAACNELKSESLLGNYNLAEIGTGGDVMVITLKNPWLTKRGKDALEKMKKD